MHKIGTSSIAIQSVVVKSLADYYELWKKPLKVIRIWSNLWGEEDPVDLHQVNKFMKMEYHGYCLGVIGEKCGQWIDFSCFKWWMKHFGELTFNTRNSKVILVTEKELL